MKTQQEKRQEIDLLQKELFEKSTIMKNEKDSNLEVLEMMDKYIGGEDVIEATPTLKYLKKYFGLTTKQINELKK